MIFSKYETIRYFRDSIYTRQKASIFEAEEDQSKVVVYQSVMRNLDRDQVKVRIKKTYL